MCKHQFQCKVKWVILHLFVHWSDKNPIVQTAKNNMKKIVLHGAHVHHWPFLIECNSIQSKRKKVSGRDSFNIVIGTFSRKISILLHMQVIIFGGATLRCARRTSRLRSVRAPARYLDTRCLYSTFHLAQSTTCWRNSCDFSGTVQQGEHQMTPLSLTFIAPVQFQLCHLQE